MESLQNIPLSYRGIEGDFLIRGEETLELMKGW